MQCEEYFADLSSQNACLDHMQMMRKLIINFTHLMVYKCDGAKLIVHSIYIEYMFFY